MRYPAAEQLEIIRLVEQSPLPGRHTLAKLAIPRATLLPLLPHRAALDPCVAPSCNVAMEVGSAGTGRVWIQT